MRNLVEYPLTPNEVLTALDRAIENQAAKKMIGDIDGVALHAIKKLLVARPFVVEDICAKDRENYEA